MHSLTEYHLIGSPSSHAFSQVVVSPDQTFIVVFSIAGELSQSIAEKIRERIITADVDSPATFYSLMERLIQMVGSNSLELSSVYYFQEKIYLVDHNGEVWLQRGEKLGKVLGPNHQLKIVEGRLQDQDIYLCFTQSAAVALRDRLSPELVKSFAAFSASLVTQLHDSGLSDRSAVSCISHDAAFLPTEIALPSNEVSKTNGVGMVVSKLQILLPLIKKSVTILRKGGFESIKFLKSLNDKPSPMVIIKSLDAKKKKQIAIGLLVIGVMMLIGIGLQLFTQFQQKKAETFIKPFQDRMVLLQSTLNQGDLRTARDGAEALNEEFGIALDGFSPNRFNRSVTTVFQLELENFLNLAAGRVELESLPVFFDFRLVRADFLASKGIVSGSNAVFVDKEKQVVLLLNLESKQQTILPVGEYSQLKDITLLEDQLYLLADGVYQFPLTSEREAQKIIEEGDSNRAGTIVGAFDINLYVFNPEERNIFRYRIGGEEESQPIGWFVDKTGIEFTEVSSMAIDGGMWLGTTTGQILKFEKGAPVPFEVNGLGEPFSSSLQIFTSEELDRIYVLEADKSRVVQISKDGTVISEAVSKELGAATGVFYSSITNQTFAVAGSLLYEVVFR